MAPSCLRDGRRRASRRKVEYEVAIFSLQDNPGYKALIHIIEAKPRDDCCNLTGRGSYARLERVMFRSAQQREPAQADAGSVLYRRPDGYAH
jgi:hypothetical protein